MTAEVVKQTIDVLNGNAEIARKLAQDALYNDDQEGFLHWYRLWQDNLAKLNNTIIKEE